MNHNLVVNVMAGRKRKKSSSYVPEQWVSEDEDGQWVHSDRVRDVPPVPVYQLRYPHVAPPQLPPQPHHPQLPPQPHAPQLPPQLPPQPLAPQLFPQAPPADPLHSPDQVQDQHEEYNAQTESDEDVMSYVQDSEEIELSERESDFMSYVEDAEAAQLSDSEEEEPLLPGFKAIFKNLCKDWLLAELDHRASKNASEAFWKISCKFFHKLYLAKEREARRKDVVQFKQARRLLYKNHVPPINLEFGYKHNTTGEITVVKGTSTPISQYPANVYTKLYESAFVDVSIFFTDSLCLSSVRLSVS